jgi:hypothetical protein
MIDPELYYRVWEREHDEQVKSAARLAAAAGARSESRLSRLSSRLWKAARPAARGTARASDLASPAPVVLLGRPSGRPTDDLATSATSRR